MDATRILLIGLQVALAAALVWSSFCRLQKTDATTRREVRLVFWYLHVAALLVLGAPAMPLLWPQFCRWPAGTTPAGIWLALLLAIVLVQVCTARHWAGGVPETFRERRQA